MESHRLPSHHAKKSRLGFDSLHLMHKLGQYLLSLYFMTQGCIICYNTNSSSALGQEMQRKHQIFETWVMRDSLGASDQQGL